MSDALYQFRVRWMGGRGTVKVDVYHEVLAQRPEITGLKHMAEIDWTPEVRCFQIRPADEGWREMTAEECRAVEAWAFSRFPSMKDAP